MEPAPNAAVVRVDLVCLPMDFVGPTLGYVAELTVGVWRTTDGGASWSVFMQ